MAEEDFVITLRGSAKLVAEFFGYSVHSILYQRGIYEPDTFVTLKKYGLRMQMSTDKKLCEYVNHVMRQLEGWLENGQVQKLVLVIATNKENDARERWVFDVGTDKAALQTGKVAGGVKQKTQKEIQKEIAAIIRQITSSVSFLPILETTCWFDLLVHTAQDCKVPPTWEETDPMFIADSSQVRLRSFNTSIHTIGTSVAYKMDQNNDKEDEEEEESAMEISGKGTADVSSQRSLTAA
eukprot:gb/GEZN01009966.1/.p1 GENE.gb/GEZN01009966.1/~~gb/GEZN01009966.1/.p1  ORF type:complete len:238 (-),score=56.50 gb/GEZN01009966.1/:542-1255(-)